MSSFPIRRLLLLIGLVSSAHAYYEVVVGRDDDIQAAYDQCDLDSFELAPAPVDFNLVVSMAAYITDYQVAVYMANTMNSNVSSPTFWANNDPAFPEFVVTGTDSFQLLGIDLDGTEVDLSFSHLVYDPTNVCSIVAIEGTSDAFGFTLRSQLLSKFHLQDDGEIILYISQLGCGAVRTGGRPASAARMLSQEDEAALEQLCDESLMGLFTDNLEYILGISA